MNVWMNEAIQSNEGEEEKNEWMIDNMCVCRFFYDLITRKQQQQQQRMKRKRKTCPFQYFANKQMPKKMPLLRYYHFLWKEKNYQN